MNDLARAGLTLMITTQCSASLSASLEPEAEEIAESFLKGNAEE